MKHLFSIFAILIFAVCSYGQNANVSAGQADRPAKILKKPHASPGNCRQSEAVTRVRAVFDASGKVTEVTILIPSGCPDWDERAVNAAKRISFAPAIANGRAVTVSKTMEYAYRRY